MIFLAIRYLLSRRRQTILTFLGIFFGSMAYIVISGMMIGFREYLVEQLVNNNPHITIQPREEFLTEHSLDKSFFGKRYQYIFWIVPPSGRKDSDTIRSPQNWYKVLGTDRRVEYYTPQLTTSVIISSGTSTVPSTLIGCDPEQQIKVTSIGEEIAEGNFGNIGIGGNKIAIGDELKKLLGVRIGQNVMVSVAGQNAPFKVVAVFKTGNKEADRFAYGLIEDVQRISQTPNRVNTIAIRLYDYSQSSAIANTWSAITPEKVESWDQKNASFFNVFRIQDAVRYLTIGATLVVAGFGIYNVLAMTVMQKQRDIAILRSMGYSRLDIVWLFFAQGLILGVAGSLLGLFCGYLFSRYLQTVSFGGGPMGGSGFLQISLAPAIYVWAVILGLASASLASILPAVNAGKLTPIEIIRSGAE
ncbi:MAG: hypothetical protein A2X41_08895 [Candidatus Margulisbacteria bacterium GWE2_39_32]|nr:MAG: hypothetical protein A2X41_08895 [Candidatus Margulisbacteria bacterium GWE2_39_32]